MDNPSTIQPAAENKIQKKKIVLAKVIISTLIGGSIKSKTFEFQMIGIFDRRNGRFGFKQKNKIQVNNEVHFIFHTFGKAQDDVDVGTFTGCVAIGIGMGETGAGTGPPLLFTTENE